MDFGFTLADVQRVKPKHDLGDVEKCLAKLSIDDLYAAEVAQAIYGDAVNPDELTADKFRELVDGFRKAVGDFFPLFRQIETVKAAELEKAAAAAS